MWMLERQYTHDACRNKVVGSINFVQWLLSWIYSRLNHITNYWPRKDLHLGLIIKK